MSIETTKPTELSKTYDPAAVEPQAYHVWLDEKCFHPDPDPAKKPYSIVIPPPNVTGALHLGHAINNTLQDILTRVHRMRGFNTVWIPGIDHAGIATQAVVEKQLKEKENKTRHEVGREGLVERIWQWKQQYGDRIIEQLKRMGCSCDWDRTRFTLDDMCARAVRETFFKLFKDGLIYRGKRLVNWDIFLQTSVSDDEIYHEIVKTSLWHIRYPIVDSSGTSGALPPSPGTPGEGRGEGSANHATYMVVATTRPETMLGDTAVAVHSEDPRWNWAIGKFVELPLTGRRIPIIADDILVDPTFGSGVVKVTPAHDPNDYAVWQRHKGQPDEIEILNILTPEGKINENGGKYAGLQRDKARKQIVSDLEHAGLLEKEQPHEAPVGHSDRSKTPIEPYLSDQWFVHMAPLAEPALEAVRDGRVKFFPERHAQQYLAWLGEKRDWPISRQLWWGHRIPVWSIEGGVDFDVDAKFASEADVTERDGKTYVCVRQPNPELERSLEQGGFVQDPDVLDTWFSSALWPHSTLGWPADTPELKQWYPTSVLLTGRDIITLWVARMVMTGLYNMGEVPFAHVAINPTILDGKGERMSKSKGNGVDPVEIIDTHGADAMRYTLTKMATETQDARLPVKRDAQGRNTSDKFDVGRNFCNKIWNATRFAIQNLETIPVEPVDESKWSLADRWLLSRLMRTIQQADEALAHYRFDQYATLCWDFFWGDLCDWYIEAIKLEMKEDSPRRGQVANILAAALDASLRLMHPMIPFITETLWWRLNEVRPDRSLPNHLDLPASKRLITAAWPAFNAALVCDSTETIFAQLKELIASIRNIRNEYNVKPSQTVTVSILAPGESAAQITANKATIELLSTCTIRAASATLQPPPNTTRATAAGCEIFVEGLIDPEAEKQRNAKRIDDLVKQRSAMNSRLSNEAYTAKAPPHLVEQTRKQLADVEAELARLGWKE